MNDSTFEDRRPIWESAPCLVISCDVDWASEAIIEDCCDSLAKLDVRPTLFSTHESENVLGRERDGSIDVGIHPNFFPGSEQGSEYEEILDFLLELHPHARISRSHSYFDNSRIAALLPRKGLWHDSNICYFLENDLRPKRMWTGATRYPVFWEDDVNWVVGRGFQLDEEVRSLFSAPGLKIIDVHPINYAFNVANAEQYGEIRNLTKQAELSHLRRCRFDGSGVRTFVDDLIRFARNEGIKIMTMHEMIEHRVAVCGESA